jgi:hypothetical protein
MTNKTVYLGGNITGLHYDDAIKWRKELTSKLELAGCTVLDSMREKE